MIQPQGSQLLIKEKVGGSFNVRATQALPGGTIQTGRWYRLQVTAEAGKLTAYWDGDSVMSWTDTTPWTSGRVGMWYKGTPDGPNGEARWRNFQATTGYPGQVVTAEDFDPWGLVTRSYISANADQRFKFSGKERDSETGYDYFGARYYDARVGRWMSVDPLAELDPGTSAYAYVRNNPLSNIDPSGEYYDPVTETYVQDEVVIEGTDKSPEGWIVSYSMSDNCLEYRLTDPIIRAHLERRTDVAFWKDGFSSFVENISEVDDLNVYFRTYENKFGPAVRRELEAIFSKLRKSGVAITPAIKTYALSVVVSFLSAQNPVGLPDAIEDRRGVDADTTIYDSARNHLIMEVQHKKLRDDRGRLVKEVWVY